MFWNPQGVDQIRQSREQTFKTDPKEFGNVLEELFGRRPDLPDAPRPSHQHTGGNFMDVLRDAIPQDAEDGSQPESRQMREDADAQAYLDLDLDEIRFTPA